MGKSFEQERTCPALITARKVALAGAVCPNGCQLADKTRPLVGRLQETERSSSGPRSETLIASESPASDMQEFSFVNNKEISSSDARVCELRGQQKVPDQAAPRSASALVLYTQAEEWLKRASKLFQQNSVCTA